MGILIGVLAAVQGVASIFVKTSSFYLYLLSPHSAIARGIKQWRRNRIPLHLSYHSYFIYPLNHLFPHLKSDILLKSLGAMRATYWSLCCPHLPPGTVLLMGHVCLSKCLPHIQRPMHRVYIRQFPVWNNWLYLEHKHEINEHKHEIRYRRIKRNQKRHHPNALYFFFHPVKFWAIFFLYFFPLLL